MSLEVIGIYENPRFQSEIAIRDEAQVIVPSKIEIPAEIASHDVDAYEKPVDQTMIAQRLGQNATVDYLDDEPALAANEPMNLKGLSRKDKKLYQRLAHDKYKEEHSLPYRFARNAARLGAIGLLTTSVLSVAGNTVAEKIHMADDTYALNGDISHDVKAFATAPKGAVEGADHLAITAYHTAESVIGFATAPVGWAKKIL